MSNNLDKQLYDELYLDKQIVAELSEHFAYDISENPLQALRRWQLERLDQTLHYAQENTFAYSQSLSNYCCQKTPKTSKQACNDLEASINHILSKLEFTLREQLSKRPEAYLAKNIQEISAVSTSQGKKLYYTQNDLNRSINFFKEALQYILKTDNQEKVAILLNSNSTSYIIQKSLEANSIEYDLINFLDEDSLCTELCKKQCQVLVTSPSQAQNITKFKDINKICRSIHSVLLLDEIVNENLRKELSKKLAADIFVHYGLDEISHVGAIECQTGHGCHIRELDLLVEIVNPDNIVLSSGLWGEVVITTLNQEAMPLIRYKTGDFGRILPQVCSCGSILKRIELQGKIDSL